MVSVNEEFLLNLASKNLGAEIVYATDDLFAEAGKSQSEFLELQGHPPIFCTYIFKGQRSH